MTEKKATTKTATKTPLHTPKVHKIDATEQVLGRLATKIALLLRGKDSADFEYHVDPKVSVSVSNASKIIVTGKKMEQKMYYKYSGYPGGLKEKTMQKLFEKDPSEVVKKAVYNMLPKNKLRAKMMKRLTINN